MIGSTQIQFLWMCKIFSHVISGCGFIGRNFVEHLIENDLVSKVRVIDKVAPELAWLNDKQKKLFQNPLIEFMSGNLIHPCKF